MEKNTAKLVGIHNLVVSMKKVYSFYLLTLQLKFLSSPLDSHYCADEDL